MRLLAWFFSVKDDDPLTPEYRQQLDAFKAECADLKPPRPVYAERDRDKTHTTTKNDILALELKREQERTQNNVRQISIRPRVVR